MTNKKEITTTETNNNRLVVADYSSPFSENQLKTILTKTPKEQIKKRPGKGGGQFDFVSGVYVKKQLNYIFGFNWNFEITGQDKSTNQVIVRGKLSVKVFDKNIGEYVEITKEQFGRADVKFYKKESPKAGQPVDIGNDWKAAATDCLKKCASEFGICSDVYGDDDFIDMNEALEQEDEKNELNAVIQEIENTNDKEKLKEIMNENLSKPFSKPVTVAVAHRVKQINEKEEIDKQVQNENT